MSAQWDPSDLMHLTCGPIVLLPFVCTLYLFVFFSGRWVATSALPPLDKLYSEVALFEERFYGITAAECNALLPHITSASLITEDDLSGKYAQLPWPRLFILPQARFFDRKLWVLPRKLPRIDHVLTRKHPNLRLQVFPNRSFRWCSFQVCFLRSLNKLVQTRSGDHPRLSLVKGEK